MGKRLWQLRGDRYWEGTVDGSEILHQLIWRIYHYLQGFIYLRWLAGFLNHQQYVLCDEADEARLTTCSASKQYRSSLHAPKLTSQTDDRWLTDRLPNHLQWKQ